MYLEAPAYRVKNPKQVNIETTFPSPDGGKTVPIVRNLKLNSVPLFLQVNMGTLSRSSRPVEQIRSPVLTETVLIQFWGDISTKSPEWSETKGPLKLLKTTEAESTLKPW
jgi:hypothetical protein